MEQLSARVPEKLFATFQQWSKDKRLTQRECVAAAIWAFMAMRPQDREAVFEAYDQWITAQDQTAPTNHVSLEVEQPEPDPGQRGSCCS